MYSWSLLMSTGTGRDSVWGIIIIVLVLVIIAVFVGGGVIVEEAPMGAKDVVEDEGIGGSTAGEADSKTMDSTEEEEEEEEEGDGLLMLMLWLWLLLLFLDTVGKMAGPLGRPCIGPPIP